MVTEEELKKMEEVRLKMEELKGCLGTLTELKDLIESQKTDILKVASKLKGIDLEEIKKVAKHGGRVDTDRNC